MAATRVYSTAAYWVAGIVAILLALALALQRPAQVVAPGLAPGEGFDGTALSRGVQAKSLHFRACLLDMALHHPTITLGQTPQHQKQQIVIRGRRTAAQTLTQIVPALQAQTAIQHLPEQTAQQGTRDAGQGESGRSA